MGHEILIEIAGGVALLLWAARMVRTGILRAFGGELRQTLGRAVSRPFRAFALGLCVTMAVQSATATALLMASFARQGLVTAAAGFAVLLGADLGSALVVQVLSFDIHVLSPLLILGGVISFMGWQRPLPKHLGRAAIGLGLLLLSLQLIVRASAGMQNSEGLAAVMAGLAADPILALLIGAILAWLAHSSVATVLLVASLAGAGVVPPALALALVLGANVGGALVAVILTLRMPASCRRAPLANLCSRFLLSLAALALLPTLQGPLAALEPEPLRQAVNFHLAFNIALALVFLPLAWAMGRLFETLLPEREGLEEGPLQAKYLDEAAMPRPTVALANATREVMRLADVTETMLRRSMDAFEAKDASEIAEISRLDDDIDALYEAIKLYLTRLSRQAMSEQESQRCLEIIQFTTNLEHIGDIIDKGLLELAAKRLKNKLSFSADGWRELNAFHQQVMEQLQTAMALFVSSDVAMARQMIAAKERFRDLAQESADSHLARLRSGRIESIETSALHLDVLRDLKRINSHLVSVAYPILDAQGELRRSRLRVRPEPETPSPRQEDPRAAPGGKIVARPT